MDYLDANLVWAVAAFFGMLSVIGFVRMHQVAGPILDEKVNSKLNRWPVREEV